MRVIILVAIVAAGLGTLSLASAQQPGSDPNFTGIVTTMDAKDVTAGRRKFEPGARTAWHSHDQGQLILSESGRMRTGRRGACAQPPLRPLAKGQRGNHLDTSV